MFDALQMEGPLDRRVLLEVSIGSFLSRRCHSFSLFFVAPPVSQSTLCFACLLCQVSMMSHPLFCGRRHMCQDGKEPKKKGWTAFYVMLAGPTLFFFKDEKEKKKVGCHAHLFLSLVAVCVCIYQSTAMHACPTSCPHVSGQAIPAPLPLGEQDHYPDIRAWQALHHPARVRVRSVPFDFSSRTLPQLHGQPSLYTRLL